MRKTGKCGKVMVKDVGKHSSPQEFYKASELRVLFLTEGTKTLRIIHSNAQKQIKWFCNVIQTPVINFILANSYREFTGIKRFTRIIY